MEDDGHPSRVYGVFVFERIDDPSEKVIVVAAHFPHPPGGSSSSATAKMTDIEPLLEEHLGRKIKAIRAEDQSISKVILVGDFNVDQPDNPEYKKDHFKNTRRQPVKSSEDIWAGMGLELSMEARTNYEYTCCADKMEREGDDVVFPYAFDRILSSFGEMETIMPLELLLQKMKAEYPAEREPLESNFYRGAFHKPIIGQIKY